MTSALVRRLLVLPLLAVLLAAPSADAAEFRRGDVVRVGGVVTDDLFAAGRTVGIDAAVEGDLFVAGANVALVGPVAEDARIAGVDVTVSGNIAGGLTAAASELVLSSRVAGDATLFATTLVVERTARIAGDINATGETVRILGDVSGGGRLAGDTVIIAGRIDGDVEVVAEDLVLEPGARLGGSLRHVGPQQPQLLAGASVAGRIDHSAGEAEEEREIGPTLLGTLAQALWTFVLGAAVYLIFPGFVRGAVAEIQARPGRNLGIGLLALIGIPLVAPLVMVTIIGIPVGIVLLIAYAATLPVGYAVAGFGLAERFRRHRTPPPLRPAAVRGETLRRFAVVAVVLALVGLVPVLGGLVGFLVMLLGLGTVVGRAWAGRRGAPA